MALAVTGLLANFVLTSLRAGRLGTCAAPARPWRWA